MLVKKFKEYRWWASTLTLRREVNKANETIPLDLSKVESFNELPEISTFDLVVNTLAITDL